MGLMKKRTTYKGQPKLTLEEVQAVVRNVAFMDRTFRVGLKGNGYFLQVQYMEEDIITKKLELQRARKWYVSSYSTTTEIVETAFKACRTSMEHVLKEHFTYKHRRVYSPHFSIEARIAMCDQGLFDSRIPRSKTKT